MRDALSGDVREFGVGKESADLFERCTRGIGVLPILHLPIGELHQRGGNVGR